MKFELPEIKRGLHWTTVTSEKALLAVIGIATCIASAQYLFGMYEAKEILLADLFMLFIYVEIIGMVGAFYSTNRIPVYVATSLNMPNNKQYFYEVAVVV